MKVTDFLDEWNKTHTSSPSFQDAIDWANKTMIEKACEWITEHIDIPYEGEFVDDSPVASDYIEYCKKRLKCTKEIIDAFRKAMET